MLEFHFLDLMIEQSTMMECKPTSMLLNLDSIDHLHSLKRYDSFPLPIILRKDSPDSGLQTQSTLEIIVGKRSTLNLNLESI